MTRAAILALALLLAGCAGAAVWVPVIAGGLGVVVGAEQIVTAKEEKPPAPPPEEHPALDGTWTPP